MARDAPGMNNDLCGEPHRSLEGRWLPGHVADRSQRNMGSECTGFIDLPTGNPHCGLVGFQHAKKAPANRGWGL